MYKQLTIALAVLAAIGLITAMASNAQAFIQNRDGTSHNGARGTDANGVSGGGTGVGGSGGIGGAGGAGGVGGNGGSNCVGTC